MRANWSNPRDPEAIPIILLEGANMDLLTQFLYWNVSLYRLCSHVIVFQQPASMSISLLSVTDKSKTKMRAHTHTQTLVKFDTLDSGYTVAKMLCWFVSQSYRKLWQLTQ